MSVKETIAIEERPDGRVNIVYSVDGPIAHVHIDGPYATRADAEAELAARGEAETK